VSPPITKRRLFGIDRSGPNPVQTRSDQPLHPWTIPNAIGYARLMGIPVFLILALSSDDGHSAAATILFAVIGWADYLDGFAARLTGQYSRLGALLDPIIDRLLVVSGMVVCWDFSLLPRWAIALVVARAPTMGAPFFAMAGVHWLALIMLYVGLALALIATVLYVRSGVREARKLAGNGA
jgi:cardiolipin synthase